MNKSKRPTIGAGTVHQPPAAQEVASPATVVIEIPLGRVTEHEYLSNHTEARLNTREQRVAMRRILRGLTDQGANLASGRPVGKTGDAVRWLLERVADSIASP